MSKYCPYCGSQLGDDAVFCSTCGKKWIQRTSSQAISNNASQKVESAPLQVTDDNISHNLQSKDSLSVQKKTVMAALVVLAAILIIVFVGSRISKCSKTSNEISGATSSHEQTIPEKNEKWDAVLCYGDGYYIVEKTIDEYDRYAITVGIVDSDGAWVYEPSEDHIFAKAIQEAMGKTEFVNGGSISMDKSNFIYLGEGVFICSLGVNIVYPGGVKKVGSYSGINNNPLDVFFFNVRNNVQTSFIAKDLSYCDSDGYMLMYRSGRTMDNFYSLDVNATINELPCILDVDIGLDKPAYSDGLFFAQNYFVNIKGEAVIDLTDYEIYDENNEAPYFVDGKCSFKFKNKGGTVYQCVIDKSGNFIEEPRVYKG